MSVLPCAICGEDVPVDAVVCPECGGNPDADEIVCEECDGEGRWRISYYAIGSNMASCRECRGEGTKEPIYAMERERAKRALREKVSCQTIP